MHLDRATVRANNPSVSSCQGAGIVTNSSQSSTNAGPLSKHEHDPALRAFKPFSSLVKIDVSALSHTGLLRDNNEDQFFSRRISRVHETLLSSLPPGDVPERAEEVNYVMFSPTAWAVTPRASSPVGSRSAPSSALRWNSRTGSSSSIRRRRRNWSAASRDRAGGRRDRLQARPRGRVPARHGVDVDCCPQPGSGFALLSRRRFPCVSVS